MLRAAAAAMLLLPSAAAAQPRQYSVEEIAGDLAYGFCPLYLAGQFSLTAPELAERGFGTEVDTKPHPRIGEMSVVTAKRADGDIAFGGAPGKVCTVIVTGERREASLAKLREAMAWTGLDFKPTPNLAPEVPGLTVETFKAPVDNQLLFVQLVQGGGPTPAVIAQLFVMEP